ncbi:MAG TPA: hypothetical protein DCG33_01655 [Prevotellaceae bacterium]|nr:hypothetical protein [Prevotellaceae bacterium]
MCIFAKIAYFSKISIKKSKKLSYSSIKSPPDYECAILRFHAFHKKVLADITPTPMKQSFPPFPINLPFHWMEYTFQPVESKFQPMELTSCRMERKTYRR